MGGYEIMVTIDTHIIIWDALKPDLLTKIAKEAIDAANATDGIIVCEISLWEIAMLMHKRRLEIDVPYIDFIKLIKTSNNYIFQGITPEIADLAANFPSEINQDPADRIICATSTNTNTDLITADRNLRKSTIVKTIW